jgi:four helix bundle protein
MQTAKSKSRSYLWNFSIDLVKGVYLITNKLPASENFGLANQIRRDVVSIPANIAEGQGRNSAKEFRQLLAISLGALAGLEA